MESVLQLVGCDRITLAPAIIEKLTAATFDIDVKLTEEKAKLMDLEKITLDEKTFRWNMNGINNTITYLEDELGNEKMCDGIRLFTKDILKLEKIIKAKLQ
jgi:transaldolase